MNNGFQFHEFAEIFPMITEKELKDLSEDIKTNTLREPITLFEQKILDGRNRYKACKMADVTPKLIHFTGSRAEALKFVESKNLHRRHLTPAQLAMAAAKLCEIDIGDKSKTEPSTDKKPETDQQSSKETEIPPTDNKTPEKKPKEKKLKKQMTMKKASEVTGASVANIKKAKEVRRKDPETAKKVEKGELSLDKAQKEVRKKEGTLTDKETAQKKGRYAITILKAIPNNYKKQAFEMVRKWLDEEIKKLESE